MAVFSITLNVMTVMVTALTVGLGIDYAIHIIERYREELTHRSEQEALEMTIHQTGSALLISGLTTVGGFAVLLLSPMPLVRNFGLLTALTIVYAVLIALRQRRPLPPPHRRNQNQLPALRRYCPHRLPPR